ncbi:MAG: hypothetical protein RBG13Loki_0611 [Promethearchaeota archaeon CR_4]|nr:MAG: hypothetical protein RBG13Loki_0611 [Candidatus Lokiarchaeota archaeon CR_4]
MATASKNVNLREVVWIWFPNADEQDYSRRPALVLAKLSGDDIILAQMTTFLERDEYSITVHPGDIVGKSFRNDSSIRPNKLFTACKTMLLDEKVGILKPAIFQQVLQKLKQIFNIT